jgi:hypothetical protein
MPCAAPVLFILLHNIDIVYVQMTGMILCIKNMSFPFTICERVFDDVNSRTATMYSAAAKKTF